LPDGAIRVSVTADIREEMVILPRFGFEFTMSGDNEYLQYFGRGPDENYCDMNKHTFMGLYASTVSQQYFPYIRPQEHGNHGNVKWAAVYDRLGRGILFTAVNRAGGDSGFDFNASHYSAHDLANATHTNKLTPRDETIVRIDYKNGGIGTGSCGPYTFDKYLLSDKKIAYSFRIQPFSTEEMLPKDLARITYNSVAANDSTSW
ncbi:MAG: beta-galactosidase small subunit, partial [Treponema sp.]|nr:beta-galactosidase small subunit [Treponema sp.]